MQRRSSPVATPSLQRSMRSSRISMSGRRFSPSRATSDQARRRCGCTAWRLPRIAARRSSSPTLGGRDRIRIRRARGSPVTVLDRLHDLSPPLRRALEHAFLIRKPEADGADERAIALATLALTRELASERPVLIAVDDLHWLDRASLRALLFAVRRLREERVGVLFATRDGAAIRRELPPGHDVLRVGPLSLGAIGRIVREPLSEDISRPMLHRIYSAAAGTSRSCAPATGDVLRSSTGGRSLRSRRAATDRSSRLPVRTGSTSGRSRPVGGVSLSPPRLLRLH